MATPIRSSPSDLQGLEYSPRSESSPCPSDSDTSEDYNDSDYVPSSPDKSSSELDSICSDGSFRSELHLDAGLTSSSNGEFISRLNRLARQVFEDMLNLAPIKTARKRLEDEVQPLHSITYSNDLYHHDIGLVTCQPDSRQANSIESSVTPVMKLVPPKELTEAEENHTAKLIDSGPDDSEEDEYFDAVTGD